MINIEKENLENAANTPIEKDLKALLEALTVKDLRFICDLFHLRAMSNKKKQILVKEVYRCLTSEDKLSMIVERFNDKEFNLLKKLINNNGMIQDNYITMEEYHFLYMVGIIFLFKRDNKFYISMSDDVYNVIKNMNLKRFNNIIKENSKVYYLLRAMVELYGVVSLNDLLDAYNKYYVKDSDYNYDIPMNTLYFVERMDNIYYFHTPHNCYFVSKILLFEKFEKNLWDIIERQKQIKKKKISKDELLKYSNYDYYEETKEIKKFKKYLTGKVRDEDIEQIIVNMVNIIKIGANNIQIVLELLEAYGIDIDEEELQTLLNYLTEIYNNSRIWSNNGWTPVELRKTNF